MKMIPTVTYTMLTTVCYSELPFSEWYSPIPFSFDSYYVAGLVSRVGASNCDTTDAPYRYHAIAYNVGAADNPAAILINGLGRYPGGPDVPLSVITVEQGKRYRFRLINMACRLHILFSITNHNLIIIEADGQTMLLLVVNEIPIYPGQQYLFILEANQPVNH